MEAIFKYVKELVGDMFYTMFPDLCIACVQQPKIKGGAFCVECLFNMPFSDHFILKENDVTRHFRGRVNIHHGAALLRFRNEGIVRNMLHGLKYEGKRETGIILGQLAGERLFKSSLFDIPDLIVPVPIHNRKKVIRGYNQSAVFGLGISEFTGIRMNENYLKKVTETPSQTGLSKSDRLLNVASTFEISGNENIKGRHVLLVDDVVTTGATLEACCNKLKEGGAARISILAIAAAV